jgi:broad specificity phosphatase PhoE
MADTLIYLIRHGETEYNRLDRIQGRGIDAPLNEAGERQAREVGAWLNTANVDVAVSSSLLRARQTAAIAMGMAPDEIEAIADLDELSYGAMEGIPVNEQSGALADLYERSGDVPQARALFGQLMRADPDFLDVADRVASLE